MSANNGFDKLENALIVAGRNVPYPATPPLAARVRAQLESERAQRPFWSINWNGPRWAFTFIAAVLIALVLLLAFPDTREAIAQLIGLRTVRIIQVTPTPTVPGATPVPSATPGVAPVTQCCQTTLEAATARARFKILLPPGDTPSQVFLQPVFGSGNDAAQFIAVFGDPNAPRYVLYQAQHIVYEKMLSGFEKQLGPATVVDMTLVNGHEARWLSGAPHLLVRLDANGSPLVDTERAVSANTLVWEMGEMTYRLETTLSEAEAIHLAESLVAVSPPTNLAQCCETTLEDARARAHFQILVPRGETPSKVYLQEKFLNDIAQQVILVFGDAEKPRLIIYESQNFVYGKVLSASSKDAGPRTLIDFTYVNGNEARWLSGEPHLLVYLDARGERVVGSERTVSMNTLVWETGDATFGTTYRLETNLSETEAVRLAESMQ